MLQHLVGCVCIAFKTFISVCCLRVVGEIGRLSMRVSRSPWKSKASWGPLMCKVFLRVNLEINYHEQVIHEKVELHLRKWIWIFVFVLFCVEEITYLLDKYFSCFHVLIWIQVVFQLEQQFPHFCKRILYNEGNLMSLQWRMKVVMTASHCIL